jgi:hypothetical protein
MQSVHILLPVWGPRYLRQCLDVCIPSLLAPGNVPAVAAAIPATFVLMTRDRDMPLIRNHPAWLALAAVCDARLESIDDLLSQAASVVLTLAYTRAIRAIGAAAVETGFVFLVADYVVADGSLRHVTGRLLSGADAVLAGNFQMVQEATGPLFAAAHPRSGMALSVSPRALVRLALDWLHPATRACMARDAVAHDPRANRVFWRIGPATLLGRFYLMHMVAIRPQTVDVTIAGPCDYSFVPEFCPTGRIETFTDSDAYMVVEMQPVPAGSEAFRPGALDSATMAGSLKEWVTAQHRRNAAHPIVYHGAEAERGTAQAIDESARWTAETDRLLGPSVRSHRHHPYWAGALDHHHATALYPVDWAALEAILGPGAVPESPGAMRQRLLGRMPLPRPWHPHWADFRVLRARLATLAAGRSLLIVSAEAGRVRAHLMEAARSAGALDVVHLEPEDVLTTPLEGGHVTAPGSLRRFDAALVIVRRADADVLRKVSDAVTNLLADNAHVVLALSDLSDADARAVAAVDVEAAVEQMGPALRMKRMETVPAPRWRIASQAEMMVRARAVMASRGISTQLRHLAVGIVCAGLGMAANFICQRQAAGDGRKPCSTALLHLIRGEQPSATDSAPRAQTMADTWTA